MKLHIKPDETIWTLQTRFSEAYPFLKLEFLKAGTMLHPSTLIRKACQGKLKTGILEIDGKTRVSELETALWERFHLRVQVFRKTGGMWLETTATDGWTLEVQNKHGHDSMELLKDDEIPDYDLSRDNND